MKPVAYIVGLATLRVVNAWFFDMSVDVFMERTVLLILMIFAVIGIRACYDARANAARRGRPSGLSVSRSRPAWRPIPTPEPN